MKWLLVLLSSLVALSACRTDRQNTTVKSADPVSPSPAPAAPQWRYALSLVEHKVKARSYTDGGSFRLNVGAMTCHPDGSGCRGRRNTWFYSQRTIGQVYSTSAGVGEKMIIGVIPTGQTSEPMTDFVRGEDGKLTMQVQLEVSIGYGDFDMWPRSAVLAAAVDFDELDQATIANPLILDMPGTGDLQGSSLKVAAYKYQIGG